MRTRQRILRFILVALSIAVLLVAAAALTLRSAAFHRYVLTLIVTHAEQASGGRVQVGDFAFRSAGLRIDLYRVALHGTEPADAPPLFQADRIEAGLRVISWLGRDVNLNDLELLHPVVHLRVDAGGNSNLPAPSGGASGKPVDLFQMAVRYAGIRDGDVYYNDEHIPLDAQAHNLKAEVRYVPGATAYEGSLSYQNALVHFGTLNPIGHDLQVRFTAAPSGVTIRSLELRSGASSLTAEAKMTGYASPAVSASYQAELSGAELARALDDPALPRGMLETKGTLDYRGPGGVPFIEAANISGTFRSALLSLNLPEARAGVQDLSGEYRLSQGNLEVSGFKGRALGGSLNGHLSLTHLAGTPVATLSADLRELSLDDARKAMRSAPPQTALITGRLSATAEASWRGSLEDLQARSDATVTGATTAPPGTSPGTTGIPLNAALHLSYDGRRQVLSLTNTTLRTPHTTAGVDGSLGQHASLRVNVQSGDLREVDRLVLLFRLASSSPSGEPSPQLLGLAGSAGFTGVVQGSLSAPQITGRLTASNLQYAGANFRTVSGNVSLSPSAAAIHQGSLQETAAGGAAQFDVSVGLHDWSFTAQSPVAAHVSAQRFQVADLARIARLPYPVTGTLSAEVSLSGSEASPSGRGSVQLARARAWGQPIQNLAINFEGVGESVHATMSVNTPAGSAAATVTYNYRQQSYDVHLQAPAIRLDRLAPLADRNSEISGTVAFNVEGHGTLNDPELKVTLDAPRLHVGAQDLSGLKAEADVADQQAQITFASSVADVPLQAKGTVSLKGEHEAHLSVDSQAIQLGPLLTAFLPQAPSGLKGQTQVHASLDGPLGNADKLQARINVPSFNLGYQSFQIASTGLILLDYRAGTITLQHSEFKGTDTDLQLQGVVPVRAPGAIRLSASGQVDLHVIELLNPQLNSSGRVNLDVSAQGTPAHPEVRGTVRIVDGSAIPVGSPIGLEQVNGELDIGDGRIQVKTLSAQAGGGTLEVHGFATYSPAAQFNVGLSAKGVRLLYPQGVRSQSDAELNLTGTPAAALLNGQIFIDRLSLMQGFDLANFAGQFSGSSVAAAPSLAQNIKLKVMVQSREQMSVESSQLSVQGSADLQVQGTVADPVILGRTDITSGEVFFEGKRFQVQNGVIQFVNPVETEPDVNLMVTTTVQQFNLTLNFVGPLDRLQTTYTSDPPLSSVDIINLLVAGHTTEAGQASPATPQSLLAQGLSSEVSSRVQKLVGISSLTIDPQIGGNQGNAGSQLAIQERVTKNLFFTFATDVTTTQGEVVQVEYQLSRKYSVSAVRDQTGGYQLEIKSHKVF
jgi:translocation and assembly module TamB